MSRPAFTCLIGAALLASIGVADQRVGLALTVTLLLVLAVALLSAPWRWWPPALLAVGLAAVPTLRDAGWVVAPAVVGSLVATATATVRVNVWSAVERVVLAPVTLPLGRAARAAIGALPPAPGSAAGLGAGARVIHVARVSAPVLRGMALAGVLLVGFGALFLSADTAFADMVSDTIDVNAPTDALWRVGIAVVTLAVSGALIGSAHKPAQTEAGTRAPGPTELRIALGALTALFALFVIVQLRVLFGGADYVRRTTGLGYGDYARQGFIALLFAAAFTLFVIGIAARRKDRVVKTLLGVLCALTVVILISAQSRLHLVVDAYGLTRVRITGQALVLWFAGLFVLILGAGASAAVARHAPRLAVTGSLAALLVFALSNPDARIARRAVAEGKLDAFYLSNLSADARPALLKLSPAQREDIIGPLDQKLARPDGLAGFNFSRARARDR